MGTGGNTSLGGFSGLVNITSGGACVSSASAWATAGGRRHGGSCDGDLSRHHLLHAVQLDGIGGTAGGVSEPALYGDGSGRAYTLTGPITLAADQRRGQQQEENNGMFTLSGRISRPPGLIVENAQRRR